jgi:ABC-type thiamine transport system substrate-binding protein
METKHTDYFKIATDITKQAREHYETEAAIAVKRITYDDAVRHLHRDGQQAYDYMAADCVMGAYARLKAENARLRALLERALEQSARVHPDFAEKIRAALKVTK